MARKPRNTGPRGGKLTRPRLPDRAEDRPMSWYLNWLAGSEDCGFLGPVEKDAACKWAGVDPVNHDLVSALSTKAGFTDPGRYLTVNQSLNLLAYGTRDLDRVHPWLSDLQALHEICLNAEEVAYGSVRIQHS